MNATTTTKPVLHPVAAQAAREAFDYHRRTRTLAEREASFRQALRNCWW